MAISQSGRTNPNPKKILNRQDAKVAKENRILIPNVKPARPPLEAFKFLGPTLVYPVPILASLAPWRWNGFRDCPVA